MPKKKKKKELSVDKKALRINYIVDHFDFEKVQKTMTALNWCWQHIDDPDDQSMRPPSVDRMRLVATRLLLNAANEKERLFGTGGFQAERYDDGHLELSFILTHYGSYDMAEG